MSAAYLHAEVEHVERSLVRVNIAKLLASDWAPERAEYDTDEEFAKGVLRKIGWRDLIEPCDEDDVGISVEGEYDEAKISVLGTVPS